MNPDDQTAATLMLHDRMTATTAHLTARPETAVRAATGGRRRIQRRRTSLIAVAVILVLITALPFTSASNLFKHQAPPSRPTPDDRYGLLLNRPVQGNLAKDTGYQRTVLDLWNGKLSGLSHGIGKNPQGPARVVWAAVTPTGPAALVVQLAVMPENGEVGAADAGRARTLIGFIGVDGDNKPRLVSFDHWRAGTVGDGMIAWFVDPAGKTLVVRDTGIRVDSDQVIVGRTDGTGLDFTEGADIIIMPLNQDPATVRLRRLPDDGSAPDLQIARSVTGHGGTADTQPYLGWPRAQVFQGGICQSVDPVGDFARAMASYGGRAVGGNPELLATGRIDDRDLLIGDVSKDGAGHAYVVQMRTDGTSTVLDGGMVDPRPGQPILIKLPGDNGWVAVHDQMGFEWRAGAGPGHWREGNQNASLIPAEATELRVTQYGGSQWVLPLR